MKKWLFWQIQGCLLNSSYDVSNELYSISGIIYGSIFKSFMININPWTQNVTWTSCARSIYVLHPLCMFNLRPASWGNVVCQCDWNWRNKMSIAKLLFKTDLSWLIGSIPYYICIPEAARLSKCVKPSLQTTSQ